MPTTSCPRWCARRTTARMTAFSPGQSPPPVRIPTFTGARLALRPDERVEQSDASTPRDRNGLPPALGVLHPEQLAGIAEEGADVVRDLIEEVTRVVLAVDVVQHATAVGVDEPSEKFAWKAA